MIQAISSPPADPVCRAISAETMKMPDPIIEPTTIIVESKRPRPRMKPDSPAMGSADVADMAGDVFTLSLNLFRGCAQPLGEIGALGQPDAPTRTRHAIRPMDRRRHGKCLRRVPR